MFNTFTPLNGFRHVKHNRNGIFQCYDADWEWYPEIAFCISASNIVLRGPTPKVRDGKEKKTSTTPRRISEEKKTHSFDAFWTRVRVANDPHPGGCRPFTYIERIVSAPSNGIQILKNDYIKITCPSHLKTVLTIVEDRCKKIVELWCLCCIMMFRRVNKQQGM